MDAAQMLTAQEIARQCEQLARVQQRQSPPEWTAERNLRLADPVTQPIPVVEPEDESERETSEQDTALHGRDLEILAFERQWWKRPGAKEQAIHELFDMSASRYYQLLNEVLNKPAAHRADPLLVKRLRKARESRQRARAARRMGIEPSS